MKHIDPIYKNEIDKKDLIIINNFIFDINSLMEWFYNSNSWINPINNLYFNYNDINCILNFILTKKILFDFLEINNFMKFDVINISKFSYIYNEYIKFNKKKNNYKEKINDKLRLQNKIFSQLESKISSLKKTENKLNNILTKQNIKTINIIENSEYMYNNFEEELNILTIDRKDLDIIKKHLKKLKDSHIIYKDKLIKYNKYNNDINKIQKYIDNLYQIAQKKIM